MSLYELDEPDVGERARVLWRRRWIVVGVPVAAVVVALAISLAESPVYRATTRIVVGEGQSLPARPARFTRTAADLVRGRTVAEQVIQLLRLDESPGHLLSRVHVRVNPGSAVLSVSVDAPSASATPPSEPGARQVAATLATVFAQDVKQRFALLARAPGRPPFAAQVWDPAAVDVGRVAPRTLRNVLVALVLGILAGILGALAAEALDRRLRTPEAIEAAYGAPVLDGALVLSDAAGFDALAARLLHLASERPLQVVGVAGPPEVAAGLAAALARSGGDTVLADLGAGGLTSDGVPVVAAQDAATLDRLAAEYRHVVAAGAVAALAGAVDGVVVALRPREANADGARAAREAVMAAGGRILGVVLVAAVEPAAPPVQAGRARERVTSEEF